MLDTIYLKSDILVVTKINKKTKAKMFENLKVGDKIEFSVPIKYAGRNHGSYATYIGVRNVETGEETSSSFNQLPTVLRAFEFEELDKTRGKRSLAYPIDDFCNEPELYKMLEKYIEKE